MLTFAALAVALFGQSTYTDVILHKMTLAVADGSLKEDLIGFF